MDSEDSKIKCFSCGGLFPDMEGPTHRYMNSSPGCWAVYGAVLAREYSDLTYFQVHRLTVDAYAVQHPGSDDQQSIQSVGLHLIRLCLLLEHELPAEDANDAMLAAAKNKAEFHHLQPPGSLGAITAADVINAQDVDAHKAEVLKWAHSAWSAWSDHHDTIKMWLPGR